VGHGALSARCRARVRGRGRVQGRTRCREQNRVRAVRGGYVLRKRSRSLAKMP
jgi:hypothetical protein